MKKSLYILFAILSALVLTGCKTSKSSLNPQLSTLIQRDTLYLNRLQYDSIFIDKYHYIDRGKDTLYVNDVSVEYRYKLLRDTVYKTTRDSIPIVKEVTVTQQVKYVPWYIETLAWIGAILLIVVIVYIAYRLIKLYLIHKL